MWLLTLLRMGVRINLNSWGGGLKDPDHYKTHSREKIAPKMKKFAYLFIVLKWYIGIVRNCPKVSALNFDPKGVKKGVKGDPGL